MHRTRNLSAFRDAVPSGYAHLHHTWKLSYVFKQLFGTTPEDYLFIRRFYEARARLIRGDTVTDIALFLGYSTSSNFITEFRKRYEVTPHQWRMNKKYVFW